MKPDEITGHVPLNINIISIQHMEQSQVIQKGSGTDQSRKITETQASDIAAVIKLLQDSFEQLNLCGESLKNITVYVQTIELQMKSTLPKASIVSECLHSIKNILEEVAGNVIAKQLLEKIIALCSTTL